MFLKCPDVTVQEQVELVSDLPWVPAGGWCHYTPPIINSDFVTKDTINIPKLHFRAVDIQLPELTTPGLSCLPFIPPLEGTISSAYVNVSLHILGSL